MTLPLQTLAQQSLGSLQSVGGYLDLSGTPIQSLGNVKVKGRVYR